MERDWTYPRTESSKRYILPEQNKHEPEGEVFNEDEFANMLDDGVESDNRSKPQPELETEFGNDSDSKNDHEYSLYDDEDYRTRVEFMVALVEDFDPDWSLESVYMKAYPPASGECKFRDIVELLKSGSFTELRSKARLFRMPKTRDGILQLIDMLENETDEREKRKALQRLDLDSKQYEPIALALLNGDIDTAIVKQIYRTFRNFILFQNSSDPVLRLPALFQGVLNAYTLKTLSLETTESAAFECALSYCQAIWLLKFKDLHKKPAREVAVSLLSSCGKFLLREESILKEIACFLHRLYTENLEETLELVQNTMPEPWLLTVGANFTPFCFSRSMFELADYWPPEVPNPNKLSSESNKPDESSVSWLKNAFKLERDMSVLHSCEGDMTSLPSTKLALLEKHDNAMSIAQACCMLPLGVVACGCVQRLQPQLEMYYKDLKKASSLFQEEICRDFYISASSPALIVPLTLFEIKVGLDTKVHETKAAGRGEVWPHFPMYIENEKLFTTRPVTKSGLLAYADVSVPLKPLPGRLPTIFVSAVCVDCSHLNSEPGLSKYTDIGYFATNRGIFSYQEIGMPQINTPKAAVIAEGNIEVRDMSPVEDGVLVLTKPNEKKRQHVLHYRVIYKGKNKDYIESAVLESTTRVKRGREFYRIHACHSDPSYILLSTLTGEIYELRVTGKGYHDSYLSVFRSRDKFRYNFIRFTGDGYRFIVYTESLRAAGKQRLEAAMFAKKPSESAMYKLVVYDRFRRKVIYESKNVMDAVFRNDYVWLKTKTGFTSYIIC